MLSTARLTLFLALVGLIFAAVPALDLRVAGWFYRPGTGFPLSQSLLIEILRQTIWTLGLLLLAGLIFMAARAFLLRRDGWAWLRGAAALLIGPGLIVNGILKAHWGRARPRDIVDFGGTAQFTPPVQITDQCSANCSFVSGEGSLAIMAALVVWSLVAPMLPQHRRPVLAAAVTAFALIGAGLRVAMGAHFLSDTIYAGLICAFLWAALRPDPAGLDAAEMRDQLTRTLRPLYQKLAATPGRLRALIRSRNS